jgi:MerR HTH family regulatory protein
MLRHYDRLGLLAPERVDPDSGYRSYGVQQLARLQRLLALRDLGFSLEQIGGPPRYCFTTRRPTRQARVDRRARPSA